MDFLKESNPYKLTLYGRFNKIFIPISFAFLMISLLIIISYGATAITIFIVSSILGIIYSTRPIKRLIESLNIKIISRIYNSKNIASTVGWLIISTIMPMTVYGTDPLTAAIVMMFAFNLIFFRNILLDLIALQGDLILGRETLPTQLGVKRMKGLLLILSIVTVLIFSSIMIIQNKYHFLPVISNIVYYIVLMYIITGLNYLIALKYEILVELNLILFIILYSLSSSSL